MILGCLVSAVNSIGHVGQLWRYPVKSMLGETVAESQVTARGLYGDRRLALIDTQTGKVASAKYPRLWRDLLAMTATISGGKVTIDLGDGTAVGFPDPGADEALSRRLGRPVILTDTSPETATMDRAVPEEVLSHGIETDVDKTLSTLSQGSPPGTFFDFAPLHLLTAATVDAIAQLSPQGEVDRRRYRPNIVLDADIEGFGENDWAGRRLRIGGTVVLEVGVPTPRCAIPTLVHGDLPRDTHALRVPAVHNRVEPLPGMGALPCVGAYAAMVSPGRIRPGDPVRWED